VLEAHPPRKMQEAEQRSCARPLGTNRDSAAGSPSVYTEVNANLQLQATMLGGPITFLNQYEAKKAQGMERTWEAWKRQALEREPTRR
jgi:hypothetical protein